jgi:hypothetical protein
LRAAQTNSGILVGALIYVIGFEKFLRIKAKIFPKAAKG